MAHGLTLMMGRAPSRWRRAGLGALVLVVLAAHGCVTQQVLSRMSEVDAERGMPPRMEVTYVRDMALSTPPPAAAPAVPTVVEARPPRAKAVKPAKAASAPEALPEASPVIEPPRSVAATEPDDVGESLTLPRVPDVAVPDPAAVAGAAPAASATSSGQSAFEWPASTRISYELTGNYRGEVRGNAQVEWIRADARYQVHMDLGIGPSFAPLITRRMTSDGDITANGLAPRRYDEETKVVMRNASRITLRFEPGTVVLANGDRVDSVPGVQDSASQAVQLVYVFSTRPEMLRPGGSVDIPLALKNRVGVWTYDVVDEELLHTSFGPLNSIHLAPRREGRKAGELSIEMWFAPQLLYLPVRIRIQQDAETYIDMLISKRPEVGQ
jgi:hypothetical protein